MDLDKLNSQLDLKNIDFDKALKFLAENQNTLIKIALASGVLVLGVGMFNDYRSKDKGFHTQMTQAQDKLEVIRTKEAAEDEFNKFKATMASSLTESELIGQISQFAKACNVNIVSLSPADSKDMGYYNVVSVSLGATSDTFKDLLLFLHKIENSKNYLRVDSWSGKEQEKGKISFDLKVSAVLVH